MPSNNCITAVVKSSECYFATWADKTENTTEKNNNEKDRGKNISNYGISKVSVAVSNSGI
jgi:hypothetical protein